jgi:hypothetical protein
MLSISPRRNSTFLKPLRGTLERRVDFERIAREVYARHYAGIGSLVRDTDLALLGRFLNAERSAVHGELLSYLFLAREFIDELIALGRRDAEGWLEAHQHLIVSDIDAARAELVGNGTDVSELFHFEGGKQVPGLDPKHSDYNSFLSFSDPDGNGWMVQEVGRTRLGA